MRRQISLRDHLQHLHNKRERNVNKTASVIVWILVGSNSSHQPSSCSRITGREVFSGYSLLPIQHDLIRNTTGRAETDVQICRVTKRGGECEGKWISRLKIVWMKRRRAVVEVAGQDEIVLVEECACRTREDLRA